MLRCSAGCVDLLITATQGTPAQMRRMDQNQLTRYVRGSAGLKAKQVPPAARPR